MQDPTRRIERALGAAIAPSTSSGSPAGLAAAIRHAVFPGGARIRPRLCLMIATACGDPTPALSDAAAALLRSLGDHTRVGPKDVGVLSQREQEVLTMLAEGLSNKEISYRLSISTHTVKFHISSIMGKLGASSRTEAVARGFRLGLIFL